METENFSGMTEDTGGTVNTVSAADIIGENFSPEGAPPAASKQEVKRNANFTIGGGLLYLGIMYAVIFAWMIVDMIVYTIHHAGEETETIIADYTEKAMSSGVSSIASIAVGIGFMFLFFRKKVTPNTLFADRKPMSVPVFFKILCIFMMGQLLATLGNMLLEFILNCFGLTASAGMEALENLDSSLSMVLYAGIFGPIAEELMFRGFIMRGLEKHGKLYAIVISSLLFGLFHSNIVQIPFAAVVGLVFAYTAMEYGIKWSILLHIFNNLVFALGLGWLTDGMSEGMTTLIELGAEGIFFILGVIFVITERRKIADFFRSNRTVKPRYRWAFTTPCFIIFTVLTLALGLIFISKLA